MRCILLLGVFCLAGCLNISGPLLPKLPDRPDDPRYSISEQEARARARWAFGDNSKTVAPSSGFETQR